VTAGSREGGEADADGGTPKARVSPYELFYDLVFAGAILGLSIDFGRTESWAAVGIAFSTLLLAWWVWQETMLFTNRFGDPLRPLSTGQDRRQAILLLLARSVCLLQMISIILLALYEPARLELEGFEGAFSWASAAAIFFLFALRELGARSKPELAETVKVRRPWEILSIGLFVAAGLVSGEPEQLLWFGGMMATFLPGLWFIGRERHLDSPVQAAHISERLMLFTLIIAGDLFLKIIVYWNGDIADSLSAIQLVFVSLIIFSIFRLYVSRVGSHPVPSDPLKFRAWLLLHLLLAFSLLVASGGMVEYVTPKGGLTYWNGLSAGFGVAGAVLAMALLDRIGGGRESGLRANEMFGLAVVVAGLTLGFVYLTPDNWRVGMGSLALLMILYAQSSSWRYREPA
jgi:low temperature requirement protein LtrA